MYRRGVDSHVFKLAGWANKKILIRSKLYRNSSKLYEVLWLGCVSSFLTAKTGIFAGTLSSPPLRKALQERVRSLHSCLCERGSPRATVTGHETHDGQDVDVLRGCGWGARRCRCSYLKKTMTDIDTKSWKEEKKGQEKSDMLSASVAPAPPNLWVPLVTGAPLLPFSAPSVPTITSLLKARIM